MKVFVIVSLYSLVLLSHATQADEKTVEEPLQEPKVTEKSEVVNDAASESEQKDKEYALGSLCNYCSYCKVRIWKIMSVLNICLALSNRITSFVLNSVRPQRRKLFSRKVSFEIHFERSSYCSWSEHHVWTKGLKIWVPLIISGVMTSVFKADFIKTGFSFTLAWNNFISAWDENSCICQDHRKSWCASVKLTWCAKTFWNVNVV